MQNMVPLLHSTIGSVSIPQLGFGTYRLKKDLVKMPLTVALNSGYKMLDTASVYDNEACIGTVLSTIDKKPFVTTKLWRSHQGGEAIVEKHLNQSLKKLDIPTIDLWLLHWPGPGEHMFKKYPVPANWTPQTRIQTLTAMVNLMKSTGKIRAVGVSNFSVRHLTELKKSGIVPAVNQVELHPFLVQRDLLEYCTKEGIVVMAYCSLGAGDKKLLEHKVVVSLAEKYKKTNAQILLRWAVQKGMVIIPCSTQKSHIEENMDVFTWALSEVDTAVLDALDCGKRGAWKGKDPDTIP
jgi:diketogulonate reductase-like aldo/keto reductase